MTAFITHCLAMSAGFVIGLIWFALAGSNKGGE